MSQNKMIEDIVREVMRSMHQAPQGGAVAAAVPTKDSARLRIIRWRKNILTWSRLLAANR